MQQLLQRSAIEAVQAERFQRARPAAQVAAEKAARDREQPVRDRRVDAGMARVRDSYATSVARGSMSQSRADAALKLITTATRYEDIGHADVVVEAVFEELGVTAYHGQVPLIKNGDLLAAAASIAGVESRHAAVLAQMTAGNPFPAPVEKAASMDTVLAAVKPLIK